MADACVFMMENDINEGMFNVGTGIDLTIRELVEIVMDVVGFKGNLVFDISKPDGTPRKLLDVSLLKDLGWLAHTNLYDGIKLTYAAAPFRSWND
jgi:GDP-L-fucose synthase